MYNFKSINSKALVKILSINVALWDVILFGLKIRGYKPAEYTVSLKRLLLSDNKSILKSPRRNTPGEIWQQSQKKHNTHTTYSKKK